MSSCYIGFEPAELQVANSPQGADLTLGLKRGVKYKRLQGELLEVREDALLVYSPPDLKAARGHVLTLVPLSTIRSVQVKQFPSIRFSASKIRQSHANAQRSFEKDREQMINLSRFPQGLSDELRIHLMSELNISAIETLQIQ